MVEISDIITYTKYKLMYLSLFKLSDKFFERNFPNINNSIEIEPESDIESDEDVNQIDIDSLDISSDRILLSIEYVYIVYKNKVKNITNKIKILLNINKTLLTSHVRNIISMNNNPIMFIKYKKNDEYFHKAINFSDDKDILTNKKLMFGKIIT